MAKIKGWEKNRDNQWVHKTERRAGYDARGNRYGFNTITIVWLGTAGYRIIENIGVGDEGNILNKYPFKARRDADAFAVAWMRSHPRG